MLHENESTLLNRICIRLFFVLLNISNYFRQLYRNNSYIHYVINRVHESFNPDPIQDKDEPDHWCLDTSELYVHKYSDNTYRILVGKNNETPLEKSDVKFMTVQYFHPKMSEPLSIEIPSGMLQIGNELFSEEFMEWYLQRHVSSNKYVFDCEDDAYYIDIIDNNLTMNKILPSQYILLDKSSWSVISSR